MPNALPHLNLRLGFRLSTAAAATTCLAVVALPLQKQEANLAVVATPSTSYVSGHEHLSAVNNGYTPGDSGDRSHGAYGNWPRSGLQWVEYDWSHPISTNKVDVYWFDDHMGVRLPTACRLKFWDGSSFQSVSHASGLGVLPDRFNTTSFDEVATTRIRLEFDSDGRSSTGLLQFRVYDSGATANFAPVVSADSDRLVMLGGKTYLAGRALDDGKPSGRLAVKWSKVSGPGAVAFSSPSSQATFARFSAPGVYRLKLTADDGELSTSAAVRVTVHPTPPRTHLEAVATSPYRVTSPFWRARLKSVMVNWIPHCIQKIEEPNLPEGGLQNFVEAAKKLAGKPAVHRGAPFANAWVYNTLESMCWALMVDPMGDNDIAAAQTTMRRTIAKWIPIILAAQEPDGYLHTMYTIRGLPRWSERGDHEGYGAGYFIEAAMAHYRLTGGKDLRMYQAAKRLADCWCANIGPAPKRAWYDGHEEIEQALVRFGALVNQREGAGRGAKYVRLAKFLLDSRHGGGEYDQSQAPLVQQSEAAGHAVRAVYAYCGMQELAAATGDLDYAGASLSLWDSIVNRKLYVTGGVGSGETSEGFGPDYSLPNNAYCESCADCGELFFQQKMQLAYQDAKFADLYEDTLYNAILGSLDLDGNNYTYTNSLDSGERRYPWHVCPCCVGNIPRTLLMLPTWMYSKGSSSVYVNLYLGSEVSLGSVAGTSVKIAQTTDYPWSGRVSIAVKPAKPLQFALNLRIPNRNAGDLYKCSPGTGASPTVRVNGRSVRIRIVRGYAVIRRRWQTGDRVEIDLPMTVQRIHADPRVKADVGRVALRFGPLLYNVESVDQDIRGVLAPDAKLAPQWRGDLLGGVMVLKGAFADGSPMLGIPNYARLNRGGRSLVWIREKG